MKASDKSQIPPLEIKVGPGILPSYTGFNVILLFWANALNHEDNEQIYI